MAILKKAFIGGIMNKDLDERLVNPDQYRDALNIDVIGPDGADGGTVRNKKGNTKIGSLSDITGLNTDTAKTIGAIAHEATNTIYYLVASDLFDGVFEYNELSGSLSRILQANKATPTTPSLLNFDKEYYVTGFRYIEGFLFWTDGLNEPFGGSIKRWKAYTVDDARIPLDTRVIKPAPLNSPVIEMKTELEQENNIEDRFLQFSYRYKYIDNQYSAFAPFSSTAFVPGIYKIDYASGNNEAMLNTKNRIQVRFETGDQFVTDIDLIVRDTRDLNTYVVESFSKEELFISDNYSYSFDFDNNKTLIALPNSQLSRLSDNVPLKAEAMEIIDRRLIYGNYTQFYDIVDSSGNPVFIDFKVDYISEDIAGDIGAQTFRSDRDLEIAIQYGDGDSRFTTGLTSLTNTTYIKPINSTTANSLLIDIKNDPPTFASEYRLLIKQRKGGYYNIFPILYRPDGVYRYFLINESDRDKFSVGDYLIFKSDGAGPTQSNKKYKILEFEQKATGFVSGATAGLYFKIKVDSSLFGVNDLFTQNHTGIGANSTTGNILCFGGEGSKLPIINTTDFACADNPIFYGTSNAGSALTIANSWQYLGSSDVRIEVRINPGGDSFKYRLSGGDNNYNAMNPTWIEQNVTIVANTNIVLKAYQNGPLSPLLTVQFSQASGFNTNDTWRINCRANINNPQAESMFGDSLNSLTHPGLNFIGGDAYYINGGYAIIPGNGWSPTVIETDRAIQAGAEIEINITSDSENPNGQVTHAPWISSRRYDNIEEWFYEEGIDQDFHQIDLNGIDRHSRTIIFRRGKNWALGTSGQGGAYVNDMDQGSYPSQQSMSYPVHMIIKGYGIVGGSLNCKQNFISVTFKITQLENPLICETDPIINDADIFHEMTDTYPIVDGFHSVLWAYEDFAPVLLSSGYTRLGQSSMGTGDQAAHKFQVGNTINVTSNNISGVYTIVQVLDAYNVIIDFTYTGSGTIPGTAGLSHATGTLELDQTSTNNYARIVINHPQNPNATYNGYAFGNGLESNRIRDDFNATTLEYSPRATTVIENYEEEIKSSSLSYSGIYRGESSVNRMNEFNLSQINYKDLDKEFGSVQKLYARDTNIIVMHENKITQVLYGKNLISDSSGGGVIASIPEVLGTQVSYAGEWGISSNPESFAKWGNNIFFTDQRRGAVLKLTSAGIFPISENGMKAHFRDLMKNNPNTQKLGVYDPHGNHYILASNEDNSIPCELSIDTAIRKYPSRDNIGIGGVNSNLPDFIITSTTSWAADISYSSGSGWVTLSGGNFPITGYGDGDIFLGIGDNNTGAVREATITITYCEGKRLTFTISQGSGKIMNVITWISNNVAE